VGQVSLWTIAMNVESEPMGKLDAATPVVVVNGPEDAAPGWDAVNWRMVEDDVRRLRQRIFTASKAGDLKKVCNLQKLMLRSRANTLMGVGSAGHRAQRRASHGRRGRAGGADTRG
jgi:RNA-directed DNA polymerase